MHFWPKFGNTDFNWWWLFARTSSKWGKFWLLSSIWPWSSRSIVPQNNRDLNQGLFHLWSKFSDSSLNSWWVIARTSWWLTDRHTHTHTHTHAGNDNTRRPKLASGNKLGGVINYPYSRYLLLAPKQSLHKSLIECRICRSLQVRWPLIARRITIIAIIPSLFGKKLPATPNVDDLTWNREKLRLL